MSNDLQRKVGFVCTFPPRKCGIATFTNDLITNVSLAGSDNFEPLVVAMENTQENKYSSPVKFEIRKNVKNDYISAADYINFSNVDLVSVQHEFGLFGGDAGSYLNILLRRIKVPVFTTLHTIIEEPEPEYYKSLIDVCKASEKLIVMNERGIKMLKRIYDIPEKKIILVPHGIPDLPFVDSNYYKHKFGMEGRRTILTFGLLGRSKGIEFVLKALPEVIKIEPSVLYIILGMTHPEVKKFEGESYRFELQRMVKDLGLSENVIFHNRFVGDEELHSFLCAADLYVTPYINPEQLTSGTLAFAVGTGKAVVSTPYWAAQELLDQGRGKLVKFGDVKSMEQALTDILKNDSLFYDLRQRAYEYGREITWPRIGEKYWEMFSEKRAVVGYGISVKSAEPEIGLLDLPEPPLEHLKRLTDDTGIFQHAKLIIPDRKHGYCTDDNARAVIVMNKYYSQYPEQEAFRLFETYMSYIMHAQNSDGTVKNFMDYDRQWRQNEEPHDGLGRFLWAIGSVIAKPPSPAYLSIIKTCFDESVQHVPSLTPRGMAYAIFGMADYLRQFPGASDIKRFMAIASNRLVEIFKKYSSPDWMWFEHILAYDNAVLPDALFVASANGGGDEMLQIAIQSANFLLENTFDGEKFSFIGCQGWHKKGQPRAQFDQQPIEAASTVMMLKTAYEITGNKTYLSLQKRAFEWFLGENDLGISLYNFKTKGCYDGLEAGGVNLNQGAESILSFLTALLCIIESYSTQTSNTNGKNESTAENSPAVEEAKPAQEPADTKST